MRGSSILAGSAILALALPPPAGAEVAEPPLPACFHPNVPATTLSVQRAVSPPIAAHYGIGGEVQVVVGLDEESRVVHVHIASSPNGIFNLPALQLARASTFRTEIRDCRPVARDYLFIVRFERPVPLPPLAVDPVRFFPGTWSCRDAAGTASTERFTVTGTYLERAAGGNVQSLHQEDDGIWRVVAGGKVVGSALPWVDPTWTLTMYSGPGSTRQEYRRVDESTFLRTTEYPGSAAAAPLHEQCTRNSVGGSQ